MSFSWCQLYSLNQADLLFCSRDFSQHNFGTQTTRLGTWTFRVANSGRHVVVGVPKGEWDLGLETQIKCPEVFFEGVINVPDILAVLPGRVEQKYEFLRLFWRPQKA